VFIYLPFIDFFQNVCDVGRYSLPILVFLFLPLISFFQVSSKRLRFYIYILISLFCLFSVVSAFGIGYYIYDVDNQLSDVSEIFKLDYPHEFTTDAGYGFENWNITFYTDGVSDDLILVESPSFQDYDKIITSKPFDQIYLIYYDRRTVYVDEYMTDCYGEVIFLSENLKLTKENDIYYLCRL